jgi:hypothetical protein
MPMAATSARRRSAVKNEATKKKIAACVRRVAGELDGVSPMVVKGRSPVERMEAFACYAGLAGRMNDAG